MSFLRLIGAVFKTFQRVEGFRRRGIFFFVQQTLCFQICCLFRIVRCRHRLPYPQHTAAEQQNAHRNPHPFVGFLFFRRGSKAASAIFCGVGIQSAGLLVPAVVMKTPVSAVCIARGRFVRRDGFICICRNGYVRGFSGAALLVARVQIPPQFPDSLVTLIRGESAGFHNDRLQFPTAVYWRWETLPGKTAVRRFLPLGGSGDSRREGEKRQSSPVHHPVQHHAQRVNVRLCAVVPAVGNLGSHVAHSAGHSAGGGLF